MLVGYVLVFLASFAFFFAVMVNDMWRRRCCMIVGMITKIRYGTRSLSIICLGLNFM
jgi:hypothetical protein